MVYIPLPGDGREQDLKQEKDEEKKKGRGDLVPIPRPPGRPVASARSSPAAWKFGDLLLRRFFLTTAFPLHFKSSHRYAKSQKNRMINIDRGRILREEVTADESMQSVSYPSPDKAKISFKNQRGRKASLRPIFIRRQGLFRREKGIKTLTRMGSMIYFFMY